MTREEFERLTDGLSEILTLPKIAGQARAFLFKKFERISERDGAKIFRAIAQTWKNGWFPRPADFEPHIADVVALSQKNAEVASKFFIPDEDRPTAEDWANFDAKISKICKNKSIPLDEEEYDPIDAMAKWEQKQAKLHESIRIMEKIK